MKNLIILIATLIFSSLNLYSKCTGYSVSVSQISDGPNIGDAVAQASITVNGGSPGKIYKFWNGFNNNSSISPNLTSGVNQFIIVDSINNCIDTTYFTLTDTGSCPNISIQINEVDSCFRSDVALYAITNGASTNNFNYLWNTGNNRSDLHWVSSGTYSVTATLANTPCTYNASYTVIDDTCAFCSLFNFSIQEQDSCNKNDIELVPNFYFGSGSYTYLWSNGATTSSLANVTSGSYSLSVTDVVFNCTKVASIVVVDDTCNPCRYFNVLLGEKDSCNKNDAKLIPNISGSGSYSFLWNTGATTNTLNNLASGNYSLKVTDLVTGCIDTAFFALQDDTCGPCSFLNTYMYGNDSCDLNDAILSVYVTGGSGVYTYLWNTGSTNSYITNQSSGTFKVTVSDLLQGCINVDSISIIDDTCGPCYFVSMILQEQDSCGLNDVSLTPSIVNGSGSYSYLWSNGSTSSSIVGLTNGNYSLTLTDLIKGCTKISSYWVQDDTCNLCLNKWLNLNYSDSCTLNDLNIYTSSDSSVVSYLWNTGATTKNLIGVGSGTYSVTVTFANGCIKNKSITVVDSNYKCCKANFYTFDSSISSNKTFYSYSNGVNYNITSYGWSFGDNTSGSGQQVNHTYLNNGTFTVCHYIETASGCKDTICKTTTAPPPGLNLKVSNYGSPYVKDTFKYTYIVYSNLGTTTEFPTIEYSYPIGCSLAYSSQSVASNVGNKLTFNIGQLTPGQSGTIFVRLNVPNTFVLGTTKNDTSVILPILNDVVPVNNTSINTDSVVSSWDPNEKLAYPQGVGADGNVPLETKEINYLIHFQNEGSFRTFYVRVEDEIDPSLDISTLALGDVSHPARMVVNGSKVTWYFENIELTPKAQNEEKSKGFISYSLKLKNGLSVGTQIKNTAYIYFDKNPAIVTNTTTHTLKVDASTSGIHSIELGSDQIEIHRNQGDLSLSSEKAIEHVEVYSLSGQKVVEQNLKTKKANFEISSWPSGIYLFNVKIKGETHQLKIKL